MSDDAEAAEGRVTENDEPAEDVEEDVETAQEETSDTGEHVDALIRVADEAEDLLDAVDVVEVLRSLDPEGVDVDDLPESLSEGNPSEAIDAGDLIDLSEIFEAVDVREFWKEARELQSATDELPDGMVPGEEDSDDGIVDGSEFVDDATDEIVDDMVGEKQIDMRQDEVQTAVQKGLSEAVEEFREGLLETRDHLEAMREANEERIESVGQPSSRNPTAVSTMASGKRSKVDATRHSTVPTETRYSNAPNRRRIYGRRFERAGDDDE